MWPRKFSFLRRQVIKISAPRDLWYGHHKGSLGLVTVRGDKYYIADIGMRMLAAPREIFNAQSFPRDYKIDSIVKGKPLTKTAQVRMAGNSVCPVMA